MTATTTDIPYNVARNYFVNNDIAQLPQTPITTEGEFDVFFGKAPVMGKGGLPTPIDFSKSYVLAVDVPDTSYATQIIPVSLVRDSSGKIVYSYKVETGRELGFEIHPCLILIVPKQYGTQVEFRRLQ